MVKVNTLDSKARRAVQLLMEGHPTWNPLKVGAAVRAAVRIVRGLEESTLNDTHPEAVRGMQDYIADLAVDIYEEMWK